MAHFLDDFSDGLEAMQELAVKDAAASFREPATIEVCVFTVNNALLDGQPPSVPCIFMSAVVPVGEAEVGP